MASFNRNVSEALEKERIEFKKDLATMAGKMMAIEATLKSMYLSIQINII